MKLNDARLIEIIKELDCKVGNNGTVRCGYAIGEINGKILTLELWDVEDAKESCWEVGDGNNCLQQN